MRDCAQGELRDLLPDLVHDRLPPDDAARVRAHVSGCADCAAEVALLQELAIAFDAPVAVDVDAVAREVLRRTSVAPARGPAGVATERAPRRTTWRAGWLKAAVLMLAVGGASLVAVRQGLDGPRGGAVATAELAFAGGVSDLADDEVQELEVAIAALERQPLADAEPLGDAPQTDSDGRVP